MTTITKAAILAFSLAALAVCSIDSAAANPAADVAAMHASDAAWAKAYNANDADAAARLYDANAVLMPPGAPAARGRAAIRAYLAQDMAASAKAGVMLEIKPGSDGGVSGSMGWVSGAYVAKDKSGKVVDSGKFLSVSKKEGGKWYYIRDTWNSDHAPAPEPAPKK